MRLSENELYQLLAFEAPRNQRKLDRWMAETPTSEVTERLATITRKYRPNPLLGSLLSLLGILMLIGVAFIAWGTIQRELHGSGSHHQPTFPFFFLPQLLMMVGMRGTAGTNAALLLARLDDERAVSGLATAWTPRVMPGVAARNRRVAKELTRLLDGLTSPALITSPETREALRRLIQRICRLSRRSDKNAPHRDISEGTTDVLIAALRVLSRTGASQDRALLKRVGESAVAPDLTPNRALLRDAALFLANPDLSTVTPVTENASPATIANPSPVTTASVPAPILLQQRRP